MSCSNWKHPAQNVKKQARAGSKALICIDIETKENNAYTMQDVTLHKKIIALQKSQ